MKPSNDYIWFVLFAAFLLAFSGCVQEKQKTTYKRDVWSETCPEGTYSVSDEEEGFICSALRSCETDADCQYLEMKKVPSRTGRCVEGKCKAYCKSFDEWEC
ncbi:MAG: hypothetical protein WAX07_03780 [Candidatus Altiarchaeia archaeon]